VTIDRFDVIITILAIYLIALVIKNVLMKNSSRTEHIIAKSVTVIYFTIAAAFILFPIVLPPPYADAFSPTFDWGITSFSSSNSEFMVKLAGFLAFVPFPICLYKCGVSRMTDFKFTLITGAAVSAGLELLQFLEAAIGVSFRYTGLSDIILGIAGALAGWGLIRMHSSRPARGRR
jgi:glycopeptide antibiotics resistance protein